MKKINIREQARERFAFSASLLVHFLLFIVLSLSGIFAARSADTEAAEVTFFAAGEIGGGGGGGSSTGVGIGDDVSDFGDADASDDAESTAEDAISEGGENSAPRPAAKVRKTSGSTSAGGNRGYGSGSGSGGGHGSGRGTGTGSGTGLGSGSGGGYGTGGSGIALHPAVPPRAVRTQAPVYPAQLKRAGVEGVCVLRLIVTTDGSVEDVAVVRSSGHADMDAAAQAAARSWRFSPAKNGQGQKVRCYYNLPMRFSLQYQ